MKINFNDSKLIFDDLIYIILSFKCNKLLFRLKPISPKFLNDLVKSDSLPPIAIKPPIDVSFACFYSSFCKSYFKLLYKN